MKLSISITACLLSLTFVGSAMAEDFTHPAGFKLWLPDGWTHENEGETLQATDPAEEVTFAFMVPDDADTLEAAVGALDKELSGMVKDLKAGEAEETKINGMDAVTVDATGTIEGTSVDLGVAVLMKGGKILLVFGAVESSKAKKHEAVIEKIITSIK